MDPTARFFSSLRRLAVTLEAETAKLQQTFENRNGDDDSEAAAKAMRAYHDLNSDVRSLKEHMRDQLTQQKASENEVNSFIKASGVMQKKVSEDIQKLKELWEKYGYQAPRDTRRPINAGGQESEEEDAAADESENKSAGEEGSQEDDGTGCAPASPPNAGPPPFSDLLRTPQLSDFGLSEMQLKRNLAGAQWCSEVPPMPEMSLPQPTLNTPAMPPMPFTPKCALQMDEDELQTPQMHDFGISEHTMCLNNDFTMDLLRKKTEKPQRPPQDLPVPSVNSLIESLQTKADNLDSPELPVICTPGFKIKKSNGHCASSAQVKNGFDSSSDPANQPTTPEVPAFQTPYMNRLVSTKKSVRQAEHINMPTDDSHSLESSTPPSKGPTGSKYAFEYNVPELSVMDVEEKPMPEMPNLESVLGNSLRNRSAKELKLWELREEPHGPTIDRLELDGPSQEFSLRTPPIRRVCQEASTPEMPDLSSVTQDICKLVFQTQSKKAVVHPHVNQDKDKNSSLPRLLTLSLVSEGEFQSLPSYLRQMTLHSLNQALHNINNFIADSQGNRAEFQMDELKAITNLGIKAPVYILCLSELKRLEHVGGTKNNSVYKLNLCH